MVKNGLLIILLVCVGLTSTAQSDNWSSYEASDEYPFGRKSPKAATQIDDFLPMIGICDCTSARRAPDGSWPDTTRKVWQFEYALNGTAIQDRSWADNFYATSIRQIHVDSNVWVVNYSTFPGVSTIGGIWLGGKAGNDIVLEKPQQAPNGMDGISRLTFYNISDEGFDWKGEWVNDSMGIVFPFWKIWCQKRN